MRVRKTAFSLIELLVVIAIVLVLGSVALTVGWKVYESSSLAISASNIRQLSVGGAAYLADHNYVFWPYRAAKEDEPTGTNWWFGLEPSGGTTVEGERVLLPNEGPLGGYIPAGFRPDPSLRLGGKSFKPKYKFGYIGMGYNILLGGGWLGVGKLTNALQLSKPGEIVVFATSAQVNNFQSPASPSNPMLEEFYGIDQREVTVHFRHHGNAMVGFANGSAGFLSMDRSTLDTRAPKANIGRFAPKGSTKYLLPEVTP